MSIEPGVIENEAALECVPSDIIKLVEEKVKKIPRAQLVEEGKLVLTKKLSIRMNIRLNIAAIIGEFKRIEHPHTKEHLPEKEEGFFKKDIDIDGLPVGGIIEIWKKISDSAEYEVIEFQKLK